MSRKRVETEEEGYQEEESGDGGVVSRGREEQRRTDVEVNSDMRVDRGFFFYG